MSLTEAIAAFARTTRSRDHSSALELLSSYCSESAVNTLEDLTGARLRDFLARWYVERASAIRDAFPAPADMLSAIAGFLEWARERDCASLKSECLTVVSELTESLPRALDIYGSLSESLAARGGAFAFPEFLASFEEGGRSLYDIDAPDEAGTREGYFRVLRVEGNMAEVEDLISEDSIWPVLLPSEAARLMREGYILNLEMVRSPAGWQITGSGLVYPPGTDLGRS